MRLLLFLIFLFFSFLFNAQGGFKTRYYLPNASNNTAKAIFETSPNNYIASGFAVDTLNGSINKAVIMGLNANGQVQWTKKYGSASLSYLDNNFITRSFYKQGNNLFYTGCALENNSKYVGVLIKFNLNGDTLWQKIYRDNTDDVIPQMITGSVDGGFLITGFFQNWVNNSRPCLLIKTDATGKEVWRRKISKTTPNVSDGKAIIQDTLSKKIIIVGYQYLVSNDINDNILVVDSLGNNPTRNHFNSFGGNQADIIQTKDKKIVTIGRAIYPQTIGGINLTRSYIAMFDINAPSTPIWKIDDIDKLAVTNGFGCLRELGNGDLLVGGYLDTAELTGPYSNNLTKMYRIDKTGSVKWKRYYDYKTNDQNKSNFQSMTSLESTFDGGWVAAIQIINSQPNPFFFVKYDANGCDSTAAHCATLNAVGLPNVGSPNSYRGARLDIVLWPNPANQMLNVKCEMADITRLKNMNSEILITDVVGREVKRSQLEQENKIKTGDLERGIYLLNISQNGKIVYSCKIVKE